MPHPRYPKAKAAEALASTFLAEEVGQRSWPDLVQYLCDASPYVVWWEGAERNDTEDPAALYRALAKSVLSSAAKDDGATVTPGDGLILAKAMLTADSAALPTADTPGRRLAVSLGFPVKEVTHRSGRLSGLLDYFDDDHRVLVVAADPTRPEAATLALAHGLAQAGDRDLWVVIPQGQTTPVLRRAAFLDRKVRVWAHHDGTCDELLIPARSEVLAALRTDELAAGSPDLGERERWVAPITEWARSAPSVVPAHRPSYLAWHCDGRMVLKIVPSPAGLRVSAGVHYSADPPVPVFLTGPIGPVEAHQVVAAAAAACAARLEGTDQANQEHRLQARLTHRDLGLVHWEREFPARRPVTTGGWASLGGDGRGFIDFLGIDSHNDLHVVETKIGDDPMLVLQGLDYWTWAQAQRDRLGQHFGVTIRNVVLDFVVAPSNPGKLVLGPYSAEQAEALSGEILWRFWTVDLTGPDTVTVERLPKRRLPEGSPRRTPAGLEPWVPRLQAHLARKALANGQPLTGGVFHPHRDLGLLPSARPAADALVAAGLDHRMLAHVRSSQAFALNLFAGLDEPSRLAVLARLGVTATSCPRATFQWSDHSDRLAETTPTSAHRTQIDVLLRPEGTTGRRVVFIEVKLSETDFGHCSAYQSAANPDRDACGQPHPFGANPTGCYQMRNHDRGRPRRYSDVLGNFSEAPAGKGCWFRLGTNQVMRNVALARALIAAGEADSVTVALCAPVAHRAIWRRWKEAKTALDGVTGVDLAELPADCVAQYHALPDGLTLANRYLLDRSAIERSANERRWQRWIGDLFPLGAAYVVGPPGWEEPNTHYVGQAVAGIVDGGLGVGISPVGSMHPGYNPTAWKLDPDHLHLETVGDEHRLLVDPGQPCWLTSPGLAPRNPYITAAYLEEVRQGLVTPPPPDFVTNPLAGIPDLGVGS